MSHIVDHTILLAFTQTPIYADQLIRQYAQRRRIMVITAPSLMIAAQAAGPGGRDILKELTAPLYEPVIRWMDWDTDTALRAGTAVPLQPPPHPENELRWLTATPVIWAALHLEQRILTRQPSLYTGHDVPVDPMP